MTTRKLEKRAQDTGFPMPQLRLALEAYTTDRWLYRRNQVAEPADQELHEDKSQVTVGLSHEATLRKLYDG